MAKKEASTTPIMEQLSEPFSTLDVKWLAKRHHEGKAQLLAYVDVRAVQDRLDAVLGVGGWQNEFVPLAGGMVLCKLRIKIDGEWIERQDVGQPSDQEDPAWKIKAAYSDALKRAAVMFGVGRYLYNMPTYWVPCDNRGNPSYNPKIPKRFLSKREQEKLDEAPEKEEEAPPPGTGINGQSIPPKRLGADESPKQEQPKQEPEPQQEPPQQQASAPPPPSSDFASLYKALTDEEKAVAKKIADAICAAAGSEGSRKMLIKYREAYLSRSLPRNVLEYLEAYHKVCVETTPA